MTAGWGHRDPGDWQTSVQTGQGWPVTCGAVDMTGERGRVRVFPTIPEPVHSPSGPQGPTTLRAAPLTAPSGGDQIWP